MSDGITDAVRGRPIYETKKNKHRYVCGRCYPTAFDDRAREMCDDGMPIEITVLGPKVDCPDARWRLRVETFEDGEWEVPITEAVAKGLMSDPGFQSGPLAR